MIRLTWADVHTAADHIAARWHDATLDATITDVYGIPQGGAPVALMVAHNLGLTVTNEPGPHTLIVDDLVDTGTTARRLDITGAGFDAMYRKPWSPPDLAPRALVVDEWVAFPWERDGGEPTDAVVRLLQHIGEDPTREGLADTPKRYVKALREMTDGYQSNAADILGVTFDEAHDQLVIVRDVEFASLCEHHLAPFRGVATLGYIPGERVVGLSKMARLVDMYAHRLQVQERLTQQLADALTEHLQPRGVGVLVTAHHTCMGNRGVRKHQGQMTTSVMLGALRDNPAARAEFMQLSHAN